jgi:hypothetical protein
LSSWNNPFGNPQLIEAAEVVQNVSTVVDMEIRERAARSTFEDLLPQASKDEQTPSLSTG